MRKVVVVTGVTAASAPERVKRNREEEGRRKGRWMGLQAHTHIHAHTHQ